jgi:tRNA (mo5U34)-methyltransferase
VNSPGGRDAQALIASNPLWYHTMELAPGVITPGWFDLRPVIGELPWPDVRGKRCLDVATFDGHLAFELERRGATEVVCTDIPTNADWDHLPRHRDDATKFLAQTAGEKGLGFRIAAEILGSKVRREWINVYDLSPERLGQFDVVVCGSLLLHLESPFRALDAIRSVTDGHFMSCEQIDVRSSVINRRKPVLFLEGEDGRWCIPNVQAHRRMLEIAGFDLVRWTEPYVERFGTGHPRVSATSRQDRITALLTRRLCGDAYGVPHAAVLTRTALKN